MQMPSTGHFKVNGDWLVYTDRAYRAAGTPLSLRVHNLDTGAEDLILSNDQGTWADYPIFDVDGTSVVYGRMEASNSPDCPQGESFISVYDLKAGAAREIDRMCVDDGYVWSDMDVSGNTVVANRWLSNALGGGHEIVLFNLQRGTKTLLTDVYRSVGYVAISGDWVAWKVIPEDGDIGPGNGLGSPDYTIVRNLRTGEEFKPGEPYGFDAIYIEEGRWLHWKNLSGELNRVHDLETGRVYTLPPEYGGYALYLRFSPTSLVWVDTEPESTIRWITGPSIEAILQYIDAQTGQ